MLTTSKYLWPWCECVCKKKRNENPAKCSREIIDCENSLFFGEKMGNANQQPPVLSAFFPYVSGYPGSKWMIAAAPILFFSQSKKKLIQYVWK